MPDIGPWRPEGWEQTKAQLLEGWDGTERNLGCLVEDTVDALLEALKAGGWHAEDMQPVTYRDTERVLSAWDVPNPTEERSE